MSKEEQKELDKILQIVMPDYYYKDMRKMLIPFLIKWHETKIDKILSSHKIKN